MSIYKKGGINGFVRIIIESAFKEGDNERLIKVIRVHIK